jgi:hypothetical protein
MSKGIEAFEKTADYQRLALLLGPYPQLAQLGLLQGDHIWMGLTYRHGESPEILRRAINFRGLQDRTVLPPESREIALLGCYILEDRRDLRRAEMGHDVLVYRWLEDITRSSRI